MSNQVVQSDLIVDLSTEEQEILAGGCSLLSCKKGSMSKGKGFSSSEDDEDEEDNGDNGEDNGDNGGNGGGSSYRFLIYRPLVYRPTYNVRI
ncbi:hypothetical protein [Trichormus sp. NMC-1]|uniref:hypothetical protein n=1 Tax=Trichormus sp. NMC-1 TaxID=1853259 RepID=UPI0008DBEAA8|nr:hypothetical protein [Trichormus sp. NMC-1]